MKKDTIDVERENRQVALLAAAIFCAPREEMDWTDVIAIAKEFHNEIED